MTTAAQRRVHERWLQELTMIPTAAGREDRIVAWIKGWVAQRPNLKMRRDRAGNLIITRKPRKGQRRKGRPLLITGHLDHPAFVLRKMLDSRTAELEFRGGVQDPYFDDARIEIYDADDKPYPAKLIELNPKAKPYKRAIARLTRATDALAPGDIGRWHFPGTLPRVANGILHTHNCDDMSAVTAALCAMDTLRNTRGCEHVGLFLTRAEEVGFIGTLAACRHKTIPKRARLICLENSRSFPDSPIGGGPILRVGDRLSVFDPTLTNRLSDIMMAHAAKNPKFKWQRKLMVGGACEATAFSTFGYEATCICLPLGNYHNMGDIDGVVAGKRPAKVRPEEIAIADFHGMIEMLQICAVNLDKPQKKPLIGRLNTLLDQNEHVLSD